MEPKNNNNRKRNQEEVETDDVQSKRSKIGPQENIIITEQRALKDIPEFRRKEIAKLIVTNDNWRKIGLYFEQEYYFNISEANLKAKYGELTPLRLCGYLIEELTQRNVSIQSFINVLNNPNIGMQGIAERVLRVMEINEDSEEKGMSTLFQLDFNDCL